MSYLNAAYFNSEDKGKFHDGNRGKSVAESKTAIAGKRCLVLDDEFLIALDIQNILEAAGAAQVVCVSNAADALAELRGAKFDLAVLDVKLSDATRTSMTVAALLQAQATPFVFLTGARDDDVHAKQFPGAPVVDKPYQAPLLLDALLRALGTG